MSTEQQFKAAVNVIRNLPPKGSVQTSNTTKLNFYAYYKQATEGPNTTSKPAFWDLVKRAKWEAWSNLGDMKREDAMRFYVDEFKKVSETVARTTNVGNIDKSEFDSFYSSMPVDDLELLIPELKSSRPNSPTSILENVSSVKDPAAIVKLMQNGDGKILKEDKDQKPQNAVYMNGSARSDDEDDDDYFLDTIENHDQGNTKYRSGNVNSVQLPYTNGYAVGVSDDRFNNSGRYLNDADLRKVIVCLQKDLEKVAKSVDLIEQRIGQLQGKMLQSNWMYQFSSPLVTFIVLFSWPVVLQLLMYWLRKRRG